MKQDTRSALLRAARRIFAKHGFEGASVRAITAAARTNLGAVTYHFGSKRKLYEAVLEACARPLADAVHAANREGTAAQRVSAVVRGYFEYLVANPDVAQLMMQELVLGRTPPSGAALPVQEIHSALTALITEGQRTGEFRAGDARIMAIGIVSQPVHMNLVRRPLKSLIGIDLDNAQMRERVIEHVTAFACAGLASEGYSP